jgi:tRNA A-37 threonylcarbamoyl transferase component Bud32
MGRRTALEGRVRHHGQMDALPGGYTNRTRRLQGRWVEKVYEGQDRRVRAGLERACLVRLAGFLPVPEVVAHDPILSSVTMSHVGGLHGQALIDAGHAPRVLRLTGRLLRELQALAPVVVPELSGSGSVIVHGDFGPQNVLIDQGRISALVDWEFAHLGEPITDLAWAEWIVRMHHPAAIEWLDQLHQAAALSFDWSSRHAAMVQHCEGLLQRCEVQGRGADLWRRRLASTEEWTE